MPDVILPVLNEVEALPGVLGAMPAGYRPLVVDNGSTDGSAELARELGATVIEEPRRGFGAACFAGLRAADAEVVCFMDCDGSLDPADLSLVVEPLGRMCDLVIGMRQPKRGAWPLHARLANGVLALELRRRGLELKDYGPMRAASRRSLLELQLRDRRSGWPLEMVLRANASGWRILGVPVPYHPRIGQSKVTGTVRGTARAVKDMSGLLRRLDQGSGQL